MALLIGSANMDERYSPILAPNLFYGDWLSPGVTYNDNYQTDNAGRIYLHKLTTSLGVPSTPGSDYTDEKYADTLIQATFNNEFNASKKIYGSQAAQVAFPAAEENLRVVTQQVRENMNQSALACLLTEGTTSATTTAITAANVKSLILAERTAASKSKVRPGIVLCSPEVYSAILEAAGTQYVPDINNRINDSGAVGHWLGMTFIECNGLAEATSKATYYDYAGTKKEIATTALPLTDFIMYDKEFFSVLPSVTNYRIIDSERFFGSLAQATVLVGYRVFEAGAVRIKKHAAA